jgi:predicted dehydrogenase
MSDFPNKIEDFNRRDFLRGGSVATLMTMLGGVEIFAQTNATPATEKKLAGPRVKVGVIGIGPWGRELLNTLARVEEADVAAICDTYPASLRRAGEAAPGAVKTPDYKTILENKEIPAVILATPTHKHKDLVIEALKAGKHVYCEAPLANSIEDARAIASAAKEAKQVVFQAGLQNRSDPQRHFLLSFIHSGALGQTVMARAQWHKKNSWRATSSNPEREKEVNWRLDKTISLGLAGEIGCHQMDQASWFLHAMPTSVMGVGSLSVYKDDGRDVFDTVQALVEYPGGVYLSYDATLANSFDAGYEMFYGTYAAVMLRDNKAWMFKETDSPLLGWEVYAAKQNFYTTTGIALRAGASKSVPTEGAAPEDPITTTPLFFALKNFLKNANDVSVAAKEYKESYGDADVDGLNEHLSKNVHRRPAAGYLEGLQATVTAIKANEAILGGQRIVLKPEWFELS